MRRSDGRSGTQAKVTTGFELGLDFVTFDLANPQNLPNRYSHTCLVYFGTSGRESVVYWEERPEAAGKQLLAVIAR